MHPGVLNPLSTSHAGSTIRSLLHAALILVIVVMAGSMMRSLRAQSSTGEIVGQVVDASGASVAKAQVIVRNTGTGESRVLATDSSGEYVATQLILGTYHVTVQQPGFNAVERDGIVLQVGQRIRVDVKLSVGSVNEKVVVVGQAPLIETEDASLGQNIENRKILDLPLNGRVIVSLASQALGVTPGTGFGVGIADQRAGSIQPAASNVSSNGSYTGHGDFLFDGVPLALCCQNQQALTPPADTVVDFRVLTTLYNSQYGMTSGALITYASRSGTNEFHGSVYEFFRNKVLDSNNFFNNSNGASKAPFSFNQYGARLGGPIIHNKTFFFGNWEGVENRRGFFLSGQIPTLAQRQGRFSSAIYDPFSLTTSGGTSTRAPFPNNQIPSNLFDTVANNLMPLFPQPNSTGTANWLTNRGGFDKETQVHARIDHLWGSKQRLFGRVSVERDDGALPSYYDNIASPGVFSQETNSMSLVAADTIIVSPTSLVELRYGYTRQVNNRLPPSSGTDLTTFGWPSAYANVMKPYGLPGISISGLLVYQGGSLSGGGQFIRTAGVHDFNGNVTKTSGRHLLKYGLDFRIYRNYRATAPSGSFTFNSGFTQGPAPLQPTAGTGNAIASFLLGVPASGSLSVSTPVNNENRYYAPYLQDDIRISSRLTLNLGLRWDLVRPRTEQENNLYVFDPYVPSPVASQVKMPELRGGLTFPGHDGLSRLEQSTYWKEFGPRFGFAWSVVPKTVVRGGYGIIYVPILSRYDLNPVLSATTTYTASLDGITPVGKLSNPYPDGILQPSANGLLTNLGQSFSSLLREDPPGYSQQWSLGIQRQVLQNVVFEAGYVGSKSTNLPSRFNINQLPDQYLSLGSSLTSLVPNPFAPFVSLGALASATTTPRQLLRPYPQFQNINTQVDVGSSIYHSGQFKLEKRFSHDFSVLAAYTVSKLITNSTPFIVSFLDAAPAPQDMYNRGADRGLAAQDVSQRMVVSYVWEMPIGRKKALLAHAPKAVDALVGGWQVNGITSYQTGFPVQISSSLSTVAGATRPNNIGQSAAIPNSTVAQWFNTKVFTPPGQFQFGNSARTLPDMRADSMHNFDISVFKNFAIRESIQLQFRAEFFNAFNSPRFTLPVSDIAAANFGAVTSQANDPRNVQLALRLSF